MSAIDLVNPLVIHHVNPSTLLALGTGVASVATLAAGMMGRWFTRMERSERGEAATAGPAVTTLQESPADASGPVLLAR